MAVVGRTRVHDAGAEQMHALDDAVNAAIATAGGPPDGLLALVVYPDGADFVICDVWRAEPELQQFHQDVQRPAIAAAGLTADAAIVAPVWSFARP